MSMEQFGSTLAPAIRELVLFKRECGAVYKHGEVLLGQFDQFCRDTEYEGTVLTENLVMRWKQHNENRKHRQKSQMLTYVRHLGQFLTAQGKDTYVPPMEHRSGTSDPIELSSVFAPFIDAFITQKRADGYDYRHGERILYRFDRYCAEMGIQEPKLTCELVYDWVATTSSSCLSCFGQFAKYMRSIGIEAYTPQRHPSHFQQQPYILSEAELSAFFAQVDSFCPDYRSCERMAAGYSIMFRLYYCCGMRLQEVCQLKMEDVDLDSGKIFVRNAKGHKDRVIMMHSDLLKMCRNYNSFVKQGIPKRQWFFPARDVEKPIGKTNMCRRFQFFWSQTPYGDNPKHTPSVHSLRHTFVVNRINTWIKEGYDMENMMPYLSRYLGHKTIDETHYYYHLAAAATDIIRSRDMLSDRVIPEVIDYEEI